MKKAAHKPRSQPTRCAIYARTATEKQASEDNSIAQQVATCQRFAKRKGWIVREECIFTDSGKSGLRANLGLKNLLRIAAINPKSFDVLLCTGIDSHVITDPFEDMRSLETHERLRTQSRVTFSPKSGISPAERLWHEASHEGAAACGFDDAGGTVLLRRDHPSLELVPEELLLDAVVFGGGPALVAGIEPSSHGLTR